MMKTYCRTVFSCFHFVSPHLGRYCDWEIAFVREIAFARRLALANFETCCDIVKTKCLEDSLDLESLQNFLERFSDLEQDIRLAQVIIIYSKW